jgi:hypothetical protein
MIVPISLHSHQHLLLLVFLIIAILVGVKWYFVVILICISLVTKDDEHLLIPLLIICKSFLEKCLFTFFAHFKIGVIIFTLLRCKGLLYFGYNSFIMHMTCYYCLPLFGLFYHFCDVEMF